MTLVDRLANGPKVNPERILLAAEPGINTDPAFSPDGRRIAYSAHPESDSSFHLFVRPALPSRISPRQLTTGGSDLGPAWSPDGGRIAFVRIREGRAQYLIIPADGGPERLLAELPNSREEEQPLPEIAWTHDGRSLVVVDTSASPPALALVPADGGAIAPITHPPAESTGDSTPAVSPDGATLAFVRGSAGDGADIYVSDLRGAGLRRLTFDDSAIRGLSWMPGGQELIYATTRAGAGSQLFRLSAYGGSPRLLTIGGAHANFPAVSGAGHRLAFADNPAPVAIWRARLEADGKGEDAHELIRSTGRDTWPSYSADGKRIVFISDRTGTEEIWVCDAEGAKPIQVTRFLDWPRLAQPRWSPTGPSLLFSYAGKLGRGLFTLTQGNLQPRLVASGGVNGVWSHDGKAIYFDGEGRVWRVAADGSGKREAVTRELGTAQSAESPDGKFIYFRHRRSVWRVPAAGGDEEGVFTPESPFWSSLQPVENGVYYLSWEFGARRGSISFYDFASKQSRAAVRMRGGRDAGAPSTFAISPDRRYILYPQVDRTETNLMLIENFR